MSARIGRRRRHRRHKLRARSHPIRIWREWLGRELRLMDAFVDYPQDRVDIPGEGWVSLYPGQRVVEMHHATMVDTYGAWKHHQPMPDVVVVRWRVVRQSEGRLFYEGRNRRYRRVPPTAVREP